MVKPPSPQMDTHGRRARELRAEDRARAEPHSGVAPGVQHRLRPARLPELHEQLWWIPESSEMIRVVREHGATVSDDALRADRRGVDLEVRRCRPPILRALRDLGEPRIESGLSLDAAEASSPRSCVRRSAPSARTPRSGA